MLNAALFEGTAISAFVKNFRSYKSAQPEFFMQALISCSRHSADENQEIIQRRLCHQRKGKEPCRSKKKLRIRKEKKRKPWKSKDKKRANREHLGQIKQIRKEKESLKGKQFKRDEKKLDEKWN